MSQYPCSPEELSQAEADLPAASSTPWSPCPTTPPPFASAANRKTRDVQAKTDHTDDARDSWNTEVVS